MNTDLEFLRYCLDESCSLPESVKGIDWQKLFQWARQQAIVGVVFNGIERAGNAITVPREELLQWIGYIQQIEQQNIQLNKRCVELSESFSEQGLGCCILKGQGNAMMYPNPLRRASGDIDVWMKPESRGRKLEVRNIIKYVKRRNPKARAEYHHIDYGNFNGVEVEVHYRPSFSNNLIYKRRLQKWFNAHAGQQFNHIVDIPGDAGSFCVPTFEFNVVSQLSHIYRHLLQEGIGLRQVIDYYYLLKSNTNCTDNRDIFDSLRYLGLEKIAGAMMWVLHEVLGLEEKYLIAAVDAKRGKFMLNEILRGGNFGHYDTANRNASTRFKKNIQRLKRDFRMVRYFPSECLWEPVFRVYHFFWRLKYN